MKNTLKLDHDKRTIIMDRTFAKFAANTMSQEYAHLQAVRRDYPTYTVEQRHIKKSPSKECYRGLTYTYMEHYIQANGTPEDIKTYNEMRIIAECHSKPFRYPTIKAWFLERFPEVREFGVREDIEHQEIDTETAIDNYSITELPVSA